MFHVERVRNVEGSGREVAADLIGVKQRRAF